MIISPKNTRIPVWGKIVTLSPFSKEVQAFSAKSSSGSGKSATLSQTLKQLSEMCLTISKKLPNFVKYPYTLDSMTAKRKMPSWKQVVDFDLENLVKKVSSLLVNDGNKLRTKFKNEIGVLNKRINNCIPVLSDTFEDPSWIPSKKGGKSSQLDQLNEDLSETLTAMLTLHSVLGEESKKIELLNKQENYRKETEKPLVQKPVEKKANKSKTLKFEDWKGLAKEIGTDIFKKSSLEDFSEKDGDSSDDDIDTSMFQKKANQKLLEKEDSFGFVSYSVIVNGIIGRMGLKVLNNSPYNFDVNYYLDSTHGAIGLSRKHEAGVYLWKNALLVGTPKDINNYAKFVPFMNKKAVGDSKLRTLQTDTVALQEPHYYAGHYYWLLIPSKFHDFQINISHWGLLKP